MEKIISLTDLRYNLYLIEQCEKYSVKWHADSKSWMKCPISENKIEELNYIWNSELVWATLTATENCYASRSAISFCGYPFVKADGRCSAAKLLEDDVILLSGGIEIVGYRKTNVKPESKITIPREVLGSSKNWITRIKENSKIKVKIPRLVLEKYAQDELERRKNFTFEIEEISS